MNDDPMVRSIRSALVAVMDLDRSTAFYREVMGLDEILREDQVVVLGDRPGGSFVLFLREAEGLVARHGQQDLGVRALCFDLRSIGELDRVEDRLRSRDMFRDRQRFVAGETSEYVRGRDPDGLPLVFIASPEGEEISVARYQRAASMMYGLDI